MPLRVPRQETDAEWNYELIESPDLGINSEARADDLQPGESIVAHNVRFQQGKVKADTGYEVFGAAVIGAPRMQKEFKKTTGTSETVLLTNSHLYTWNTDVMQWQFVKGDVGTTLSADATATATALTVTSIIGFADGDPIGIVLDNLQMHMTTVNGTPSGSTINITDAMPSLASSTQTVIKPVEFSGTNTKPVDMKIFPANNWLVITNGVDVVHRYDGTDCVDVPNLPSSGDTICEALGVVDVYLLLLNTTEGGTRHPQRVRRCDTGDPTNWTTGNAGYNDLAENSDYCVACEKLGDIAVIYKETSICHLRVVATDDRLFQIDENVVPDEGIKNPQQVIPVGDAHVMKGKTALYLYEGGEDLIPLTGKVFEDVFSVDADYNPGTDYMTFLINVKELQEIWMVYPKSGDTIPQSVMRMKINRRQEVATFAFRRLSHPVIGYGLRVQDDSLAWEDLSGDWASQTYTWASQVLLAASPNVHLCDPTNLRVYNYNYSAATDNGTTISWSFETQDFYNPAKSIRFDKLDFVAEGESVLAEISNDQGQSWTTIKTQALTTNPTKYSGSRQVVGHTIRFRFSGTGTGFALSRFGFRYSLESEELN